MTLPEPGGCPHCGSLAVGYANNAGVRMCISCKAPRTTAEPGCPVRNVMACEGGLFSIAEAASEERAERRMAGSIADETARERRVHGGGPRIVHRDSGTGEILEHDPDTGEARVVR